MSPSRRRLVIGAAAAVGVLIASAAPAMAAPVHHAAAVKRFQVHGLVLAVHGSKIRVLSSTAAVGSTNVRNRVVTLTVTARTHKSTRPLLHPSRTSTHPLAAGQSIVAAGTVASNGALMTATATATILAAEALVGQVTSVSPDGKFITVARHDQVDGEHAEHDNHEATVVSAAGAKVIGAAVALGQYVVVLGETDSHNMLAAAIYTFAAPPALAVGRVTASDSATRTVTLAVKGRERDGQDDIGDDQSSMPFIKVDASHAQIVVNGVVPTTGTPAAFPSVGDQVLAVGTAGSTPTALTATLVFVFDQADTGSVADNEAGEQDRRRQHHDHGHNGEPGQRGHE